MARLKKVQLVDIVGYGTLPHSEAGFKPSGDKREHKAAQNAANGGHIGTAEPATLKVTVLSHPHIDVQELGKMDDVQINITLTGGQQHIMSKAFCEETPEEKEGEFEITFIANISEKI